MLPTELASRLVPIDEQVYLVPGAAEGGRNGMLVVDGDVVLVDAGLPDALAEALAPHVDVCFLTHCHAETSRAARHFREVWVPRAEARALHGLADHLDVFAVPPRDRGVVQRHLGDLGWTPRRPERAYRPGGMLQLAQTRWHMMPAPGHSPGLTLLLEPKRHYLWVSDLDGGDPAPYGWPSADLDDLLATLESLPDVDVAVMLGSRSEPRRRGIRPMFREMAAEIRARDLEVLRRLERPMTLEELAETGMLQGPEALADPYRRYVERVMVEKHLARLIERSMVAARQDGRYQRVD